MATHFSILALEIPRTEEPGGLQSRGLQELDMIYQLHSNNNNIILKGMAKIRASNIKHYFRK